VQCTVCSVQYAACNVQRAACSVQREAFSVQRAVCSVHYVVFSVQCVVCSVQRAVCANCARRIMEQLHKRLKSVLYGYEVNNYCIDFLIQTGNFFLRLYVA
jgi:uncharacterized membrane protein